VELPRPRTAAQLMHDEQAIRARAHVVESLTDQLESARAKRGSDPLFADGVKRGSDPISPPLAAAREVEL